MLGEVEDTLAYLYVWEIYFVSMFWVYKFFFLIQWTDGFGTVK